MARAGDFNRDGNVDIAVSDYQGDSDGLVTILLGDGLGAFPTATAYDLSAQFIDPYGLDLGDFDGDGVLDLALGNMALWEVEVMRGFPDGTFAPPSSFFPATGAPTWVAAGDLNRDGDLDLVATNENASTIDVFMGNGDLTFDPPVSFAMAAGPTSVHVADVNRDGNPDLVTTNYGADNMSVRLGDGLGGFGAPTQSTVGTSPVGAAIGDLNHDGRLDVVTANSGSANVSVKLGNGSASFPSLTNYAVGNEPVVVALDDINDDGHLDIVAVNWTDATSTVLIGSGTGTFSGATTWAVGTNPRTVLTADFDRDGHADVGVGNAASATVSILRNTPAAVSFEVTLPASVAAGIPFNATVRAVDGCGNTATAYRGTVQFSSSDPSATLPANVTFGAADAGSRVVSVTLATVGAQDLDVVDTLGAPPAGTGSTTVRTFARLQVLLPGETAAPGTPTGKSGTALAQTSAVAFSVVVNAVDANWYPVTNVLDVVALSFTDPNATVPGAVALIAGTRTFSVTPKTAGSWTVSAADVTNGAISPDTSSTLNVVAGAFAKLQLLVPGESADPGSATGKSGTPAAQTAAVPVPVTVNAVDANWNVVAGIVDTVSLTSSDPNANLPAPTPLTNGSAALVVTFRTSGGRTVTATDTTDGTKTASTSPTISVAAGPFVKLQILIAGETAAPGTASGKTGTPATQRAGTAIPTVIVNAVDADWNRVTTITHTVHLATTDPAATLPVDITLSAGTRTFASNVNLRTPGTWTVTASDVTDPGKTPATSADITVVLGPFAKLQILLPGETAAPGTTFGKTGTPTAQVAGISFPATVNAVDSNWYPIDSVTDTVRITSSDPNATLPADTPLVAGTTSVAVTLKTGGNRTLTATDVTDGTKTAIVSGTISVAPNTFTRLQVLAPGETAAPGTPTGRTGSPSNQLGGIPFNVTVNAVDDWWNKVSSVTDTVAITSSDPLAILPANNTLVAGTRNFAVTFRTLGNWTVTATDVTNGTKGSGTTPTIPTTAGTFSRLLVLLPGESWSAVDADRTSGTPTPQTVGVPFNVTILALDSGGFPVTTATDTVRLSGGSEPGTFPADAPLVSGSVTLPVTLFRAGSNLVVTASDVTTPAILPDSSADLTVAPGPWTKMLALLPGETAAPGTGPGKSGTPIAQQVNVAFNLTVRACDDYWNRVPVNNVVTITSSDPTAVLPPPLSLQNGESAVKVRIGSPGSFTFSATESGLATFAHQTIPDALVPVTPNTVNDMEWGPDGNLWFLYRDAGSDGAVGRMTPGGAFSGWYESVEPLHLASGSDGNIWYSRRDPNDVAQITSSGTTTLFNLAGFNANDLTTGPDGHLWVIDSSPHAGKIFRLETNGTQTSFPDSSIGNPYAITEGADGNLWYTDSLGHQLVRETPLGVVTKFLLPDGQLRPTSITTGPDGNVWFTADDYWTGERDTVGQVAPDGTFTLFTLPLLPDNQTIHLGPLQTGGDGQLWIRGYDATLGNHLVRFSTAGQVLQRLTDYGTMASGSGPVAKHPSGTIWFGTNVSGTLSSATFAGGGSTSATSSSVDAALGPFVKLQLILPGETAVPGSPTGKSGSPLAPTAGVPFNAVIRAVDSAYNLLPSVTDTVRLTSTDVWAEVPTDTPLSGGSITLPITLRTAGTRSVTAEHPLDSSKNSAATSVVVWPNTFTRLHILAPGETWVPGSPTGKSGTASSQQASVGFTVVVRATDDYWNLKGNENDLVGITSSDGAASPPSPQQLSFGVRSFTVTLKSVGVATVTAEDITDPTILSATTGPLTVASGSFTKLLVLVPGETSAPGTPTGKTGTPTAQTAGVPFDVTVLAVDPNWYPVGGVTDTVALTSTDGFATLPPNTALSNGAATLSVTLRAGPTRTVTATDVTNPSKTANTSSAVTVNGNAFTRLLLTLPGETWAPGGGTGKTGTASPQTVGVAFNAVVRACDDFWNLVPTVTDTVGITSDTGNVTLPPNTPLSAGVATLPVTFTAAGARTLTASDITDGAKPSSTVAVSANSGTFTKLQILLPGETAAPGTASGKTGTPTAQVAGVPYNITVNAVDANWYVIGSASDTVRITAANDANAILPPDTALSGGTATLEVTNRTAGTGRTLTASDMTSGNGTQTPNTSPAFAVNVGPFTKLQILIQGETAAPGTVTGKTGTVTAQRAGTAIPSIVVRAVDDCWNLVNTITHTIHLTSTDTAATIPADLALVAGTRTWANTVNLKTPGTWTVTASNVTDPTKLAATSADIPVNLGPFAKLQILLPGETAVPGTPTGKTGTPTAQAAGVPFDATVNAVDSNWYLIDTVTDTVHIASNDAYAVLPADAPLVAGTGTFTVTGRAAATNRTFTASDVTDGAKTANTSANVTVAVGPFTKLQVLVSGETAAPGSPTGKTGTVTPQRAGTAVPSLIVNACDDYWNRVTTVTHTVHLETTDVTAVVPANQALVAGTRTFANALNFKTPGTWTVTASDVTDPAKTDAISADIPVTLGPVNKLQVLLPGETAAPGTASGKTGTPTAQVAGVPFNFTVNAVDSNWYLIDSATDSIQITSSDANAILPPNANLVGGTQLFEITLRSGGNRTITASDATPPPVTANTSASVLVGPNVFTKLQVLAPGETSAPGTVSGRTGTPTAQRAGTAFNVTVNACDDYWNRATTATDVVSLSTDDPDAVLPANIALAGGTRVMSMTLRTVGTWAATATDVTDAGKPSHTTGPIPANLGPVNKLQILLPGESAVPGTPTGKTGTPTPQVAGVPFSVTVNAVDSNWYPITTVTDTVHIASNDAWAVLPADAPLVAGTGTFLVTSTVAATNRTFTASDVTTPAITANTSSNLTVTAAAFTRLQVLVPGETAAPGSPTGKNGTPNAQRAGTAVPGIIVNACDDYWNRVTTVTHTIHFASTDASATLPADQALAGGTRTYTNLVFRTVGTWTVTVNDVTDGSKTPSTSAPVPVTLGAFAKLQILLPGETAAPGTASGRTGTPTPQTAGVPFDVTVNAVDSNWYFVGGVTDTVRITSNDIWDVLPADAPLVDGTATFSITMKKAATNRTATASDVTDGAKTAHTSSNLVVGAAAMTRLQILVSGETAVPGSPTGKSGTPSTQRAGTAVPSVKVSAVDEFWNVVPTITHTVALSTADPAAGLPANQALAAGTRTFTNFIFRTPGDWTITTTDVTDGGMPGDTSASIPVVLGPFARLQVLLPGETAAPGTPSGRTGTPTPQTAGVPFDVVVNGVDSNWYPITSSADTVHLTSNDANAELPADAPLVGGTVTLPITMNTAGSRTVTATDVTDGTKTAHTSAAVTVGAGGFTRLQILLPGETAAPGTPLGKTGSPTARTAGTAFNITVNAVDDDWNRVTTVTDTVAITSNDPTAVLPANLALSAGTRAINVTLRAAGSTATLTATDVTNGAKLPATSAPIPVNRLAFSKLLALAPGETLLSGTAAGRAGSPSAQVAGVPFNVTVHAVDAWCNLADTATDTIHLASTDASATLPSDAPFVAGVVTMSVTLRTGGTSTVTATDVSDGTKTASTTTAIPVGAGPASKLQILAPGESAAPGTVSGKTGTPTALPADVPVSFVVNAVDDYWNRATGIGDTVRLTSTDGTATLPADTPLVAGTANLSLSFGSGGVFTVTATDLTDGGRTPSTSPSLTVIGEAGGDAGSPLVFANGSKTTLTWGTAVNATSYRVYQGSGPDLAALETSAVDSCLRWSGATNNTGAAITQNPPANGLYWYLAVGVASGVDGSAGETSSGPRILNSSGNCP